MSARASSWSLEHAGGLAGAGHQGAIAHNKPAAFRALGKAGGVCFLSGLDFSDEGGNELKVGSGSAEDEGPRGPASGGGGGTGGDKSSSATEPSPACQYGSGTERTVLGWFSVYFETNLFTQ